MTFRGVFIASAILVVASVGLAQQMPRYAYLMAPANTTEALIKQMRTNPVVRDRFVRHYQMTPNELEKMFRSLRLERLNKDTWVELFGVPKSGELRGHRYLLKAGTEVWVDNKGFAIMKVSCGNPLGRMDRADEPDLKQAVGAPAEAVPMAPITGFDVEISPVVNVVEPLITALPEPVFVETPALNEVVNVTGSQQAGFSLPFLGLLPTLLVGIRPSGGPPVPEPATIFAITAGVGLLINRRRRSR